MANHRHKGMENLFSDKSRKTGSDCELGRFGSSHSRPEPPLNSVFCRITIMDGQELYNDLVRQPGVCRNCFARTHEHLENWYPSTLRSSLTDILQESKFFSMKQNVTQVFPPEKQTLHPPSKNICKCGVYSHTTKTWGTEDPLTRENLKRNTKNLCALMEEAGIEFDTYEFVRAVLYRKSEPEYQNRDEKIFHDALEETISPPSHADGISVTNKPEVQS